MLLAASSTGLSSPPTEWEYHHQDLWMTYIAQSIIGPQPEVYPDILGGEPTYRPDKSSPSHRQIRSEQKDNIRDILRSFGGDQIGTRTLKWCVQNGSNPYPTYDLVCLADEELVNRGTNVNRIARIVSNKMHEIYTRMVEGQHTAEADLSAERNTEYIDRLRKLRLSLRALLVRFCAVTGVLPETLSLPDLAFPSDSMRYSSGNYGHVYRIDQPSGVLAFKSFRYSKTLDLRSLHKLIASQTILLSCLKHPNLTEFIGLYEKDGSTSYIVSPWMENGDLEEHMQHMADHNQPIPRIRWIYEIACGLRYLHDEFVVHGDLHARNILVDNAMHMRITDFGLAGAAKMTNMGGITRDAANAFTFYTAPELAAEGAETTSASDVWSFGCLCLLIWTDEPPYIQCKNTLQFIAALVQFKDTPENTKRSMDSFYADQPEEQARGAFLRSQVALPCWSYDPDTRPNMAQVEDILSSKFKGLLQIQ